MPAPDDSPASQPGRLSRFLARLTTARPIAVLAARRALRLAAVACLLLLAVGGLMAATAAAIEVHFNSDLLFPVQLYRDLFGPVGVRGWNLPPAPYFFPDLALLFPLLAASGDWWRALMVFGALQLALLLGAAWTVATALDARPRRVRALAVPAVAVLWIIAVLVGCHASVTVAILPIFHAGALVAGVVLLGLWLRVIGDGARTGPLLLLAVLASLIASSDLFAVLQFVVPLLIASALARRAGMISAPSWHRLLVALAAAAGVVCLAPGLLRAALGVHFRGNPVLEVLSRTSPLATVGALVGAIVGVVLLRLGWLRLTPRARRGSLIAFGALVVAALVAGAPSLRRAVVTAAPAGWPLANLRLFLTDLGRLVVADPLIWIGPPVAVTLSIRVVVRGWPSATRPPGDDPAQRGLWFLSLFYLCAAALMLVEASLAWIGLGHLVFPSSWGIFNEGSIRHLQPLYLLPPLLVAWWIVALGERLALRWRRVAVCLVVLVSASRIIPAVVELGGKALGQPYPEYVRCVEGFAGERGLTHGAGDYWTARHLSLLSRTGLHVLPLRTAGPGRLGPEDWVDSRSRALDPSSGGWPRYSFLVLSRLGIDEIVGLVGTPAARRGCSGMEVWAYDRPTDVAFRGLFRVAALELAGLSSPPPARGAAELRHRFPGDPLDGAGVAVVPPQGLALTFDPPVAGNVVEISSDGDHALSLSLDLGDGAPPEELTAPRAPGPGLRPRFLLRSPERAALPVRSVTIRPSPSSSAEARLGHLHVYLDPHAPGPPAR